MIKSKVMKLRELQTANKTVYEIAEALTMSVKDVECKLIDLGYKPIYEKVKEISKPTPYVEIPQPKARKRLSGEEKSRIYKMKLQGKSMKYLAETFNVCVASISKAIKEEEEYIKQNPVVIAPPAEKILEEKKVLEGNDKKTTAEEREEMINLHNQGYPIYKIAGMFNCTQSNVVHIIKNAKPKSLMQAVEGLEVKE